MKHEQRRNRALSDAVPLDNVSMIVDNSFHPNKDIDELFDASKSKIPFDSVLDFTFDSQNVLEFERESGGVYSKNKKKLASCKSLPLDAVWSEFSPFFRYRFRKQFENFAALFLTIWKRESNFAPPKISVIVQANCKSKPPALVRGLQGKNLKSDLKEAEKRLKGLEMRFKGCNLKYADYGPMQWNYHWRLQDDSFRPLIVKALLLSTSYRKYELSHRSHRELANLVRFQPRALFILAGLDLNRCFPRMME